MKNKVLHLFDHIELGANIFCKGVIIGYLTLLHLI